MLPDSKRARLTLRANSLSMAASLWGTLHVTDTPSSPWRGRSVPPVIFSPRAARSQRPESLAQSTARSAAAAHSAGFARGVERGHPIAGADNCRVPGNSRCSIAGRAMTPSRDLTWEQQRAARHWLYKFRLKWGPESPERASRHSARRCWLGRLERKRKVAACQLIVSIPAIDYYSVMSNRKRNE